MRSFINTPVDADLLPACNVLVKGTLELEPEIMVRALGVCYLLLERSLLCPSDLGIFPCHRHSPCAVHEDDTGVRFTGLSLSSWMYVPRF